MAIILILDHETEVDFLNYEAISRTVVELLKDNRKRALTVGIHGDWGAGKSSILKMIEGELSTDGNVACLWFNGWAFQGFIERLWRSLKYEEIYLKAYDSVDQAKQGIGDWMNFYNQDRRHASLGRMIPDQVYHDLPSGLPLAA